MSSTLALLLLLQLSLSFTVFSQDEENLVSWVAMPPHHHHHHPPAPSPSPTPPPPHPPGHHHHHHHRPPPPPPAPAHPPSAPPPPPPKPYHPPPSPPPPPKPSHPPMAPPPKPYPPKPHPSFKRLLVAVEGVVFLKSCKYAGKDTLYLASPLPGATVQLQCNSTVKPIKAQAQTDKNGYFLILGPKTLTNYAAHKCKVSLLPSKLPAAQIPSDLHGGLTGATLNVDKKKPLVVVNKVEYALFHVGPFAFEPKCPK